MALSTHHIQSLMTNSALDGVLQYAAVARNTERSKRHLIRKAVARLDEDAQMLLEYAMMHDTAKLFDKIFGTHPTDNPSADVIESWRLDAIESMTRAHQRHSAVESTTELAALVTSRDEPQVAQWLAAFYDEVYRVHYIDHGDAVQTCVWLSTWAAARSLVENNLAVSVQLGAVYSDPKATALCKVGARHRCVQRLVLRERLLAVA